MPVARANREPRLALRREELTVLEFQLAGVASAGDAFVAFAYSPTGQLYAYRAGDRLADAQIRAVESTDVLLETDEGPHPAAAAAGLAQPLRRASLRPSLGRPPPAGLRAHEQTKRPGSEAPGSTGVSPSAPYGALIFYRIRRGPCGPFRARWRAVGFHHASSSSGSSWRRIETASCVPDSSPPSEIAPTTVNLRSFRVVALSAWKMILGATLSREKMSRKKARGPDGQQGPTQADGRAGL